MEDRMIENIAELVNIPSITGADPLEGKPYGNEVNRALEYVIDLCGKMGFRTKNCSGKTGYAEIGDGDEMIGILCHLDVVPPGNDWNHSPFDAVIEEGKLYGRGTVDDKGPAIAAIYAMKDLLDQGIALKKRIRIIFGLQEETGDWPDIAYYKATEELPDMGFTPDSKFPAIFCEKGIAQFRLTIPAAMTKAINLEGGTAVNMVADHASASVYSNGKSITIETKGISAHGSRPEEGDNAITKLMEILAADYYDRLGKWYMSQIGHDIHGERINCGLSDDTGDLTLNAGKLSMDASGIFLDIDIRYPGSYTSEDVLSRIRRAVEQYEIAVEKTGEEHPVYIPEDSPVIQSLMKSYQMVTGDDTPAQIIGGGTYARAMENIVAFGPAFPGEVRMEHKADEYVAIDKITAARKIYMEALNNLLDA